MVSILGVKFSPRKLGKSPKSSFWDKLKGIPDEALEEEAEVSDPNTPKTIKDIKTTMSSYMVEGRVSGKQWLTVGKGNIDVFSFVLNDGTGEISLVMFGNGAKEKFQQVKVLT